MASIVSRKEIAETWAGVDATLRVDAPRLHRRPTAHDKQPNIINHAKRYRAARKEKLRARNASVQG